MNNLSRYGNFQYFSLWSSLDGASPTNVCNSSSADFNTSDPNDCSFEYVKLCYEDTTPEEACKILAQEPVDKDISEWIIQQAKAFIIRFHLYPLPEWLTPHIPDALDIYLFSHPESLWNEIGDQNYNIELVNRLAGENCRDFLGLHILHYTCMWKDNRKFILIKKLIELCPDLLMRCDFESQYPFDKLFPQDVDNLLNMLEATPYPGFCECSKGESYRWLSLLCGLEKLNFAEAYAIKNPHSLLPIEFSDPEKIDIEGRFVPHQIENLPMSVLGKNDNAGELISRFLELWNFTMKRRTGIDSNIFSLYLPEEYAPPYLGINAPNIAENNALWKSFPLDIDVLFGNILETNKNRSVIHHGLQPLYELLETNGTDAQKITFLNLLHNYLRSKPHLPTVQLITTPYYLLIFFNSSQKTFPDDLYPDFPNLHCLQHMIHVFLNYPKIINFEECFEPILKTLNQRRIHEYVENHMLTQSNLIPLNHNLNRALYYCKCSPLFRTLLATFPYDPYSEMEGYRQTRFELSQLINTPILNPYWHQITPPDIYDQFKAAGYYIFQSTEAPFTYPEAIHETSVVFQSKPKELNFTLSSENLIIKTSIIQHGLMQITVKSDRTDLQICLRGYFTSRGYDNFISKFIRGISETSQSSRSNDDVLCYIQPKPPTIEELEDSMERMSPIRFVINKTRRNLNCYFYNFKMGRIFSYEITVHWNPGFILDLRSHLEIAISRYHMAFAREMHIWKQNREAILTEWPEIIVKTLFGGPANLLYNKLIQTLDNIPTSPVIVADPFNDRYFFGWKDGDQHHTIVLPFNSSERLKTLTLLKKIKQQSTGLRIDPAQLSYFVNVDKAEVHSEPVKISLDEVMEDFHSLCISGQFNMSPGKQNEIRLNLHSMSEKILLKQGFQELNPEHDALIYDSINILFTQAYSAYKTNNREGLASFMLDIANHEGFCVTGVRKEIWQHYYINFPDSVVSNQRGHFERAVTETLSILMDQLQRTAVSNKGKKQSVHLRNHLFKHLSKVVKIPPDPLMLHGQDPFKDPWTSPLVIGKDFDGVVLSQIATHTLLPSLMLHLIRYWESAQSDYHAELLHELSSLYSDISLADSAIEKIVIEKEKFQNSVKEKTIHLLERQKKYPYWSTYSKTIEIFPRAIQSRKRERDVELLNSEKKQRDGGFTAISDKLMLKLCLKEMKQDKHIAETIQLQSQIQQEESVITGLTKKHLSTIRESLGDHLHKKETLTELDEMVYTQELTPKGALDWLRFKGVLVQTEPVASSSSSSS